MQVLRADLVYRNMLFRTNPLMVIDPNSDVVARPYDKIPQFNSNDGYGFGFGITGGYLWKLDDKLDAGFSFSIPLPITVTGSTANEYYLPNDPTLWQNTDSAAIGNLGTVGQLFLSGKTVEDSADFKTELQLPPSIGIGFAYKLSDRLTATLDAEYTFWSLFGGLAFTYTKHTGLSGPADSAAIARDFFTSNVTYATDWKSSAKVMLGARYNASDLLTIMAGTGYDQSPARDATAFGPTFVDTGNKLNLSGGVVFHIQRWDLGVSSSYTHLEDRTVDVPSNFGAGEDFVTFPGDYKAATYETVFSFNYRF